VRARERTAIEIMADPPAPTSAAIGTDVAGEHGELMKTSLSRTFAVVLASTIVLLACASPAVEAPPAGGPAETAPSSSAEPAAASTSGDAEKAESFDLVVRALDLSVHWTTLGEKEVEMIVAVRDDEGGRRVAWTAKTTKAPEKTAELRFPNLLRAGGTYQVAVSGVGARPLFSVGPVTKEVVLDVDQATADESSTDDAIAYDIINTPVTLPAGTYTASLGPAGTSIKVIVDSKGKLSLRRADYGCGAGACGVVSIVSDPLCEPELVRADTMAAKITDSDGKQSLVVALKQEGTGLRVEGKIANGTCCSHAVDVLAKRTSAEIGACE
jgi:hypothetical protein